MRKKSIDQKQREAEEKARIALEKTEKKLLIQNTVLKRKCRQCEKEISYTSYDSYNRANIQNRLCQSCGISNAQSEKLRQERRERWLIKENNPCNNMLGKKRTVEHNEKLSGKNHGMYGKSLNAIWEAKYGTEIANEKREVWLAKLLAANLKKTHGNHWTGWYKGWLFRSSYELSFMINVIERFHFRWLPAETLHKIPYEFDGQRKTYVADFLLNEKMLVEIKPKKLHTLAMNLAKKQAAEHFCEKKGWKYKITEPVKLYSHGELLKMHLEGTITLQPHKLKRYVKLLEEIKKVQ